MVWFRLSFVNSFGDGYNAVVNSGLLYLPLAPPLMMSLSLFRYIFVRHSLPFFFAAFFSALFSSLATLLSFIRSLTPSFSTIL